jgi:hypothetical protein
MVLDVLNGDVIVERNGVALFQLSRRTVASVTVVGSAERLEFGDDVSAAVRYACEQARRRGARAFEKTAEGYAELTCPPSDRSGR